MKKNLAQNNFRARFFFCLLEFRKLIFDEEYNVRDVSEEAIYSAMLGAVTSFLLESPGATTNAYVDSAIEKAEYQEMVDALNPAEASAINTGINTHTVAPTGDSVYNRDNAEGGLSGGERENSYSGNKWIGNGISGKSDTEGAGTYGKTETGIFEQGGIGARSGASLLGKDNEGREISEEDSNRLRDTVVKDDKGRLKGVYHYTPETEFTTFEKSNDIGFHFGSEKQAIGRKTGLKKEDGRIFRVYLNFKNPIKVSSDIMGWKANGTALKLWSDGYLTDAEKNEIVSLNADGYDSPAAIRLREILAEKGYDGIVYPNGFEGDGDSYIAFSDDQIIKTEIKNIGENFTTQQNNNEEAVDVGAASTASSSYSEGVESASPVKPGFTPTEYSKKIGNKTLRALDAIGKKIGVEISIGAPTGDGKGAYNGYYENGRIVIAQDAKNPLEVVLSHEVTHHMQRTAPEEYNAFVELAINAAEKISGAEKTDLINRYRQAYADGNTETFSDQAAINEITADFASRLVNDISLFNDLARSNKSVAVRFIESVKEFLAKVKSTFSGDKAKADTASLDKYGARVSELEAAVAQWEKMLSTTETAVARGNINTAGTDADGVADTGIIFSKKGSSEDLSIKQQLKRHLEELNDMDVVVSVIGRGFDGRNKRQVKNDVVNELKSSGYAVERKDIGRIVFAEKEINDALDYLGADAEILAFKALPRVLKRGIIIDGHPNHKLRGFPTITIAAPVELNGARGNMAVVIKQTKGNRYKVHRITTPEGSAFDLQKNNEAESTTGEPFTESKRESPIESASGTIISDSSEKSNKQNSLKTEDLLSREYVGAEDTSSVSRSSTPSPQGEGSKEAGVDEYFEENHKRAQVVSDERLRAAESALMDKPGTKKKTVEEKAKESASFLKRKFVNSGDAVRKIAKATKDKHLYGAFNRARSSMNIVSDMLKNKQTNVLGQKVGESLEGIIAPIKEKGDEYFRDFQLYLLHKHNVARMGLKDTKAEARAQAELELFIKENPDVAAMGETELQKRRLWEDDRGLKTRKYLDLRENLNQAQNTNNKPIFFDNDNVPLSAQESESAGAELLRKNPGFKEDEAKIRAYLDNLMEYRIDSGLITQEEAEYFRKKYPDYVPTYRDTENVQKQLQGKLNIGTAVGRAKGGNEKILPLDVALAEMTKKVVRSGQKNIFANKVFDLYNRHSDAFKKYITDVQEGKRDVDSDIDSFGDAQILDNTVQFHNDGKSVELTVTPELFEAFDAISNVPKEQPAVARTVRKINDVYKKLITTYDPTFIVRNGIKDLQDALLNSTSTRGLIKNLPRAYKEIATGGEMWELYQAAGGLYSSRFEELHDKGIVAKGGKIEREISLDMSEKERFRVLKDKKIKIQTIEVDKSIDTEYLEKNIKSIIEKPLMKRLKELGYLKTYHTDKVDVEFELTNRGVRKSLHSQVSDYGGSFGDFAKIILNLQKLLDDSVVLEIHSDKARGTQKENRNLRKTYVLFSAFVDNGYVKPVQFEIKEYVDNKNRLYLAVALTKIETGVVGNTVFEKNQTATNLIPVSEISLTDIFAKINPKDKNFLKYVPDNFLDNKQLKAKTEAIKQEIY